jgi:HD superfamily phosphohydrolase YqeK
MCPPSSLAAAQTSQSPSHANIADVVPQTQISRSAYEHAASVLASPILNHSIRVYLYAKAVAAQSNSMYSTDAAKHDLLFTACLFHDIGTCSTYDGPQRFEVEGGDAAVAHLTKFGVGKTDKHDVWTAIACHTCPGIAERIGELARLVRIGVETDFGRETSEGEKVSVMKRELEAQFERAGIEKVLGDAVVEQAKRQPQKAPTATWPGVMYRAYLEEPEWDGVNKMF